MCRSVMILRGKDFRIFYTILVPLFIEKKLRNNIRNRILLNAKGLILTMRMDQI